MRVLFILHQGRWRWHFVVFKSALFWCGELVCTNKRFAAWAQ